MTKTTTPNVFDDYQITLTIPAQHYTAAHRKAIKKALPKMGPVSLQQHCAVAEATNAALGGVYQGDRITEREVLDFGDVGRFVLNPSAHARFGITATNKIFLTVGLIEEDQSDSSTRYRLTWQGEAVPETLARIAVAHDAGESHKDFEVDLDMGSAKLVAAPKSADRRPDTPKRRAQKNGPADRKGQPRKHRRICSDDLIRTYVH
jgi:hypothetical protein